MRGNELLQDLLSFGVLNAWIAVALGAAWLMTRMCRKHAAMRHLIRLTALMVLLAIPVLAQMSQPHYPLRVPIPASAVRAARLFVAPNPAVPSRVGASLLQSKVGHSPRAPHRPTPITKWRLAGIALACLWAGGAVWFGLQPLIAIFGLRRLYRNSEPGRLTARQRSDLERHIGLMRAWELRVSATPALTTAMTWGFMRPVVLLPHESSLWTEDRYRAVLLHELAHVKRGDSLTGILAYAVCALYWFHPAVWFTANTMREDAEGAADDAVLMSGVKPSVYASELMHMAKQSDSQASRCGLISVSFLRQSKIETRIGAIVGTDLKRQGVSMRGVQIVLALTALIVLASLVLRPSVSVSIRPDMLNDASALHGMR